MDEVCPSLARFGRFHDACVGRMTADPVRFNPRLIEFATARLRELCASADLSMRIRSRDLEKIVEDDRFKQMVELGHGATLGGPSARQQVVETLFDVQPGSLAPQDYPKYGYLGSPDKRSDFFGNLDLAHHYGSVIVTFRRERVLPRTTLVFGDSVNFRSFLYKVPTWLSAPHPVCLATLPHHGAEELPAHADPSGAIKVFAVLCAAGKLTVQSLSMLGELFGGRHGCEFFELHYHGELVFSRDVKSIDVMPWDDAPPDEALVRRIRSMGIDMRISSTAV